MLQLRQQQQQKPQHAAAAAAAAAAEALAVTTGLEDSDSMAEKVLVKLRNSNFVQTSVFRGASIFNALAQKL